MTFGETDKAQRRMLALVAWPVLPLDVLVHTANLLLLAAVLCAHHVLPRAATYAACHVILAFSVWLIGKWDDPLERRPFEALALLHHWLPAILIVLMYFELGVLIPLLRDYSDQRYDHALQAIDVWLLGDPLAFIERHASAALSDVLTACYFAYYPFALLLPAALYLRGRMSDFQQAAAIILLGFLLSYVGYFLFPALGPHRVFDAQRPAVLDGLCFSRVAYEWLRSVPHEPPDAFPSGHALIAVLVPTLAWRMQRSLFYVCAPIAAGIIMATVYLRLHYVADVIAALILAPVCYQLGCAITRRMCVGARELA